MEKPISIMIDETKTSLISMINNSGLPFWILEPMVKDIYQEIKTLAGNQLRIDKEQYNQFLLDNDGKNNNIEEESEN